MGSRAIYINCSILLRHNYWCRFDYRQQKGHAKQNPIWSISFTRCTRLDVLGAQTLVRISKSHHITIATKRVATFSAKPSPVIWCVDASAMFPGSQKAHQLALISEQNLLQVPLPALPAFDKVPQQHEYRPTIQTLA